MAYYFTTKGLHELDHGFAWSDITGHLIPLATSAYVYKWCFDTCVLVWENISLDFNWLKYGIRNPWGIRSPRKSHQSSDVKEKLVLVALLCIWRQGLQNRTFFRRHAQRSDTVQGIRSGENLNKCRTPESTVIILNAWSNWNVDLWQFLSRRFLRPLSGLRFRPLF